MQSAFSWAPKVASKCESKHWYACGADGRSVARYYDGCGTRFSHPVQILGFLLMSAFLNRFGVVQTGYFLLINWTKPIVANKIIYTNSMNREDLSKLSKGELINMLMGKQTASAKRAGPVNQTASAKKVGPAFNPKSLTQLAAEKMEQSRKRPAKQPSRMPSLTQLAARALVKDRINTLRNCPINKLLLCSYYEIR